MLKHDEFTLSSKWDPRGMDEALLALRNELTTKEWWVKSCEETSLAECRKFADHPGNNISVEGNKGRKVSYLKAFVASGHVRGDMQAHVLGKVSPVADSTVKKQKETAFSRQKPEFNRSNNKFVSAPKATVVAKDVAEEKNPPEGDGNTLNEKEFATRQFIQAYKPQELNDDEIIRMILKVQPNFRDPLSLSIIKDAPSAKKSVSLLKTGQPSLDMNTCRSVPVLESFFHENSFTLPERADRNECAWQALLWNILAIQGFISGVEVLKGTTLLPEFQNLIERTIQEPNSSTRSRPSMFANDGKQQSQADVSAGAPSVIFVGPK